MKKALFTLCVDNYAPEITRRSHPLLRRYADKIGAEFRVITERKWPHLPAVAEKLQIFELGRDFDYSLYIDSDALVNPDLFDLTEHVPKDTVLHYGADFAGNRWTYDRFFRRDGRNIGSGNWFTMASDWCLELWEPLTDITYEQALANIHPQRCEAQAGLKPEHFIDDYTVGRNIAKYGLKFTTYLDLLKRLGRENETYLWHQCLLPQAQKIADMDVVLKAWGLHANSYHSPGIQGWMNDAELQWLHDQAAGVGSVVEVGSWLGRSTHALLSACKGTVYAVDHFRGSPTERETTHAAAAKEDIHAGFMRNVGHFQNLKVLRGDSPTIAAQFSGQVDMVFIDGDHSASACLADIRAWLPRTRRILCGHDRAWEGVPEALAQSGLKWQPGPGSIWFMNL
jgi:hypothetical protein